MGWCFFEMASRIATPSLVSKGVTKRDTLWKSVANEIHGSRFTVNVFSWFWLTFFCSFPDMVVGCYTGYVDIFLICLTMFLKKLTTTFFDCKHLAGDSAHFRSRNLLLARARSSQKSQIICSIPVTGWPKCRKERAIDRRWTFRSPFQRACYIFSREKGYRETRHPFRKMALANMRLQTKFTIYNWQTICNG